MDCQDGARCVACLVEPYIGLERPQGGALLVVGKALHVLPDARALVERLSQAVLLLLPLGIVHDGICPLGFVLASLRR